MLRNNREQVTIFVIIALVIVAGVGIYFLVRGSISISTIESDFVPVYDYYSNCIEEKTRAGIDLAGSQGGRIDSGVYIPGSEFAPSSNELNFLGFPVPYWMVRFQSSSART